ncbi:hypothetical protein BBO99_00002965 [Phytophthora kernoviae]|uniref:Pex N-terminal domain-containing protein n=2 Tax=Phytophthora kernoviae TaxID=325452 RepID=A0A3R7JWE8_9STRA|nr:hypothetical protein G195_003311 [Phytophthora kernoviae 00238/432]KAG2526534.1 hypothetical protein JM16_002701 [Phytophthora kernoviae]KAG2528118.1 hypothetical protein JM18_003361 [Phytophthora kernoviae]RLN02528.1 hypothetical protein BBI17_003117 [Phytophthora kernoviae]RLN82366.1 hypothetical protein BBO99_00002965 [Phytophthora kernoviae]
MQERMAVGFKPAIEYLVHTLCESYPHLALSLPVRRLDETYALLRYGVENYFLSRYDSLATEKFYGMKRVMLHAAGDANSTSPLTPRARKLALLFAVLMPYLKAKLDAYHKQLAERLPRTASISSSSSRREEQTQRMGNMLRRLKEFQYLRTMQKGFVATYPFAHFAYEGSFFLYQWLYLFGDTPYFSPVLKSMKTILVRVTQDDESVFRQNETTYREKLMEKLGGPGLFDRLRRIALRTTWATLDHSYVLLLLGIAGYKFVEWMYSEEVTEEESMASIAPELEQKLVTACEEGNIKVCWNSVVELQSRYALSSESVAELLGYAFSCAAAHNQIDIMALLLYPTDVTDSGGGKPNVPLKSEIHSILLYGMCRWEKYFPGRPRFQCCFALRYLAYTAIVCVEQNALLALEFLVQQQETPIPPLLADTDVVRCFEFALELGSDLNSPAPEIYRPLLMMLLHRYPTLLLPHVNGKHESVGGIIEKLMDALRASLLYEYVTNPQLQT